MVLKWVWLAQRVKSPPSHLSSAECPLAVAGEGGRQRDRWASPSPRQGRTRWFVLCAAQLCPLTLWGASLHVCAVCPRGAVCGGLPASPSVLTPSALVFCDSYFASCEWPLPGSPHGPGLWVLERENLSISFILHQVVHY